MAANPPAQNPSVDAITSRNATRVDISFQVPGGSWARVGRVQSFSQDIANNVQVLTELGSQFAVEVKKGITIFTFSIAKFYVRSDVFDQLRYGAIFGLQIADRSNPSASIILEQFSACSMQSVSRQFATGQATVAQNATIVTIGDSTGSPD